MPHLHHSLRSVIAISLAIGISACGKDEAPKPAAKPPAPSQAPAAQPAPTPKAAAPAPATPAMAAKPAAADPDKALASKVKATLDATTGVPGQQIDVTVKGGAVTLWGTVGDPVEQAKAVEAAKAVPGVKAVDNKLAVVKGS